MPGRRDGCLGKALNQPLAFVWLVRFYSHQNTYLVVRLADFVPSPERASHLIGTCFWV
jgi:hypothetical protein